MTVTVADLSFDCQFTLSARRDDFCHALVSWFDIEFTFCHVPVVFSTGPNSKYTHWKQTVMYLEEILCMRTGEQAEGNLKVVPNQKNPRDLDLDLWIKFSGESQQSERSQKFYMR